MERTKRTFKVKDRLIGGERPMICIPLVGKSTQDLLSELDSIISKQPDIIEWRADFFEELNSFEKVKEALLKINESAPGIPLLFTIRSEVEGGQQIALDEEAKLSLIKELIGTGKIDIVDYELVNEKRNIQFLRQVTSDHGVRFILSYHNFDHTPSVDTLYKKGSLAEEYQADVIKVAVMPNNMDDVLVLLQATQAMNKQIDIPVVSMSMGGYGSISRMFGWRFGSAITFGVGAQSSAPGQVPVDELRSVINIIEKSL